MPAEWITAAQVVAASAIAYLGGKRSAQATEKTAQTTSEATREVAETNAGALSLSYVFKELENVRLEAREKDKLQQARIEALSLKCDVLTTKAETLQARVYVLEQEKQTTSLEHEREIAHRDREVEKLQEIVGEREARMRRLEDTQKDLIAFIQSNYKCDEEKLVIGTIEISFKDKFTQRSLEQAQAQRQERQEKDIAHASEPS